MQSRRAVIAVIAFGILAFPLVGTAVAEIPSRHLEITFFAVGNRDTALYRGPCGEYGAVDVANADAANEILGTLGERPKLAWIAPSHYHQDHLGGVVRLAEAVEAKGGSVGNFYDRGGTRNAYDSDTYRRYFDFVSKRDRKAVNVGTELTLCEGSDQVTFTVKAVDPNAREENDRSVCLHVEYIDFDLATCGDATATVERDVVSRIGNVDVVKVNHHGAATSSHADYVSGLAPQVAVIPVGTGRAGHPDPGVVDRWRAQGGVYLTSAGSPIDGKVVISTSGVHGFSVLGSTSQRRAVMPLDENRFSVSDAATTEGDEGVALANFVISRPLPGAETPIGFATFDGTASGGRDYLPVASSILFPAGATDVTVTVAVSGDDEEEPSETFGLGISTPLGNNLADAAGQATIVNDDIVDMVNQIDVVAKSGDTVQLGPDKSVTLTGVGRDPSVNDEGQVAFVGHHDGGEGIFVWKDGDLRSVNPQFSQNRSRSFGDTVSINNSGIVVGRDRAAGSPPASFIRLWNTAVPNEHTVVARGGVANEHDFTAVVGPASVANGGGVAFIAQRDAGTYLATSTPPYNEDSVQEVRMESGLRPMAGGDGAGSVVVKTKDATSRDVLRLYSGSLSSAQDLACASTSACVHPAFEVVGRSAGISDDGTMVAFSGVKEVGDDLGSGVFVSRLRPDGTRRLVRVAGPASPDGPISRFDLDARVAVNAKGSGSDSATVAFVAYDASGNKGLYMARVDGLKESADDEDWPQVRGPWRVVKAGDEVDGLPGRVKDLSVYDALNEEDNQPLVFWVETDVCTPNCVRAILRRAPLRPAVFIPGLGGTELVDGETVVWPVPLAPDEFYAQYLSLKEEPGQRVTPRDILRPLGLFYGEVLTALEDHGYREYAMSEGGQFRPERRTAAGCDTAQRDDEPTLFVFGYDWRRDIADSARALDEFMGCVRQFYPDTDVNVVAHSMGGLLARRYVLDNPGDHGVNALVGLANPWLGAPKLPYVLESGDFLNALFGLLRVRGPGVKHAAESMVGAHQLMPSASYVELGGALPFGEDGRDFDGNGNDREIYPYDKLVDVLDFKHPGYEPASTGAAFHSRDQDNWQGDDSGVEHYLLYAEVDGATTIGRVLAVTQTRCEQEAATDERRCPLPQSELRLDLTRGDGTVPTISARRTFEWNGGVEAKPLMEGNRDHVGMLGNWMLHEQLIKWLDNEGGPNENEPQDVSPFRLQAEPESVEPAAIATYRYMTIAGTPAVVVSDDKGNTTDPNGGTGVPGVEEFLLGEGVFMAAVPATGTIRTTFQTTAEPVAVEILTGEGTDAITEAIRYVDLSLPDGVAVQVESTGAGVEVRYDANGDGTFETAVPPTTSVNGPAAKDRTGPTVKLAETVVNGQSKVAIQADDASGVESIFYSVDGSRYQRYTGEPTVDPAQHPVVYAFADDKVGNRGSASIRLTPPPDLGDNAPPVAKDVAVEMAEDSTVNVALDASDPEGLALSFTITDPPDHGTLTGDGASRTYTPAPDFHGQDRFTYKANDGSADSNPATVTITVRPVNDAPVAVADSLRANEDAALEVAAPGVLGNDRDVDGDQLRAVLVSSTAHGTVQLRADGSLTYVPSANFSGPDQFTYKVNDGSVDSSIVTVSIDVAAVNDPPVCATVRPTTASLWPPNHQLQVVTLNGATDPEGDAVRIEVTTVEQDEPVNGLGDGDTGPDAVSGQSPEQIQLRVERSGNGDGRVYQVSFAATDSGGARCSGVVTVGVPRNQNGSAAVDSAPARYNSR